MSDQPATIVVEMETLRIYLKNGMVKDFAMQKGEFPTLVNRIKNDGMFWSPDVAIPYDNIFIMERIATQPSAATPQAGLDRMH